MTTPRIDRVTVLGGGVLGGQIGWHSAYKGKSVVLYDPYADALRSARAALETYARTYRIDLGASDADIQATWARLSLSGELAPAVAEADLVIEAVPEVPEVKDRVYREMSSLLSPRTLIATNSSTLLPRDFADATGRPGKFCALHFANLIWKLNVVEVMAHPATERETLAAVARFAIELGMVPIAVAGEQNGYVLNSWLVPLLLASVTLVVNGVSTPEDVDRTFMIANRGCAMGPCGFVDVIGMRTAHDVASYWGSARGDMQMQKNAAYIKDRFLDRGHTGLMSGQGFYRYPNPTYAEPGFLAVPDLSVVPVFVDRILRNGRGQEA